jgi:hypothetical protein
LLDGGVAVKTQNRRNVSASRLPIFKRRIRRYCRDHQHLEHGADAAGHDDERVGGNDEMMKPSKERFVLERLLDERIHILLERQLDADSD